MNFKLMPDEEYYIDKPSKKGKNNMSVVEKEEFLKEYIEWSSQPKFKDFKFITKITKKDEEKLLEVSSFNLWAFLFGPFYYFYLGMYRGIFYLLLSILLFSFGIVEGCILYFIFAIIIGFSANRNYVAFLKRKKEKYRFFNPDADTRYFNISNKRLFILSLLTGGMYLMYWMYRNAKAMNLAQKDPIRPVWQAIFMSFTSINVFRAINYSSKKEGYKKDLDPLSSAWLFFLLTAAYSYEYEDRAKDLLTPELLMILLSVYWVMLALTILLVLKYQKAISFYSKQKSFPFVKRVTFWECVFVVLGFLLNMGLVYATGTLIVGLF